MQEVGLQLGSIECRACQSVILEPNVQCQLDHLRHLHVLDKNEDGDDRSWGCIKVLKYSEESKAYNNVDHRFLVEWKDLNRSQSRVSFFALCLCNPIPIIPFAKGHNLLKSLHFVILYRIVKPNHP
jgi:hypothetical protein